MRLGAFAWLQKLANQPHAFGGERQSTHNRYLEGRVGFERDGLHENSNQGNKLETAYSSVGGFLTDLGLDRRCKRSNW